jgi:poly(A) polymerase
MNSKFIDAVKQSVKSLFYPQKIDETKISKHAIEIIKVLKKNNYEAYIVGGAIRDILMNKNPKDFDIATDATPEQIKLLFRRSRIIGRRFKLVHVMDGRDIIEVSTFRAKPHNKEVMRNGVTKDNEYGTLKEDAERRDFTCNSIYYNPLTKVLIDLYGGVKDIRVKKLAMIGDPKKRFDEDSVRILRAIRFAAKLNLTIDKNILEAIESKKSQLQSIPYSRLFDEIMKLFLTGHALQSFDLFRRFNLSKYYFPSFESKNPKAQSFLLKGLSDTDDRVRANKSVNPGFLLAVFLWSDVKKLWEERNKTSINTTVALHDAIDLVLAKQSKVFPIQKRFGVTMSEIWRLQPRFSKLHPKRIYRLLGHPRFRAAYDFMLLRDHHQEIEFGLGKWWTNFIVADEHTKSILVKNIKLK